MLLYEKLLLMTFGTCLVHIVVTWLQMYKATNFQKISSQTYRHVPIAVYSLLNVAPDDGLMTVRNM